MPTPPSGPWRIGCGGTFSDLVTPATGAAIAAAVILGGLAAFQLALALGAPYGRFAWGGRYAVLPTPLRVGSLVTMVVYVLCGVTLLDRAGVIDVLDELQKNSLDFYAQLRSLSQQRRAAELRRGAVPDPGTDFYLDPNAPPAEPGKPAAPPSTAPQAGKERANAHPIRKAAVRCSIMRKSPSAPPRCSTATNSERRVASSEIVPLR